jgi:hypothetical protein
MAPQTTQPGQVLLGLILYLTPIHLRVVVVVVFQQGRLELVLLVVLVAVLEDILEILDQEELGTHHLHLQVKVITAAQTILTQIMALAVVEALGLLALMVELVHQETEEQEPHRQLLAHL